MTITEHRDLRTGTPVWLLAPRTEIPAASPAHGMSVDVAIVGGGVSGALIADALLDIGKSVAVFERRGFTKGSTAASTALLQFEIDQPFIHLAEKIGRARAAHVYWESAAAVDYLAARVQDLEIDCGFRARHAVYLPGNVLGVRELRREADERAIIGLRSQFIDRDRLRALTTLEAAGAIWSAGAADIDPVAFADGLWRSALARGARLCAPVEIEGVEAHRDYVTLHASDGTEIKAKHTVFATGYELLKMLDHTKHRISSTWAIATKPQAERLWPTRCLIWEAADPYLYIRTTADGRVVVGGEDEDISDEDRRDALLPKKSERLQRKLQQLLPGLDVTPDAAWAGCFGESPDALPTIGPIPRLPRCYAVIGFGGNGITFSAVAAKIIRRALLQIPDPAAELFAFAH